MAFMLPAAASAPSPCEAGRHGPRLGRPCRCQAARRDRSFGTARLLRTLMGILLGAVLAGLPGVSLETLDGRATAQEAKAPETPGPQQNPPDENPPDRKALDIRRPDNKSPAGEALEDEALEDAPTPVPFPQASLAEMGLKLPQAPVLPVVDRRVVLATGSGETMVGRVYLEVGTHYVVLLPDGHLVSVPILETTATDRPFEPLEKKQLAKRLLAERFPGFRTRDTRRYLYVYNCSDDFVLATSRILETMYPALANHCRRWKLPVEDPEFPLVVVVFRTQEEFQKYREMPPGIVAYYNGLSNHVLMYEQSNLTVVAPELSFKQSVSTIAHEGVHQILHNIGVQQRLSNWPLWLSEGLAEYFAPTELGRKVRWKGVGLVNDLRLYELGLFYKGREGKSTEGVIIRQAVESAQLASLDYATSWSLIHYLAKFKRDPFVECLQEASRLQPLENVRPATLFQKHVSEDYARAEADMLEHVRTLPFVDPIANQTHYVLMLLKGNVRETLVSYSPQQILNTQKARAGRGYAMDLRAFPDRTTAEQFAQRWRSGR